MRIVPPLFLLLLSTSFLSSCGNNAASPLRNGQVEDAVSVTRDSEKYVVKPAKSGDWKVYQGSSVKNISWSNPTYLHGGDSLTIYLSYPENRLFFALEKAEGSDTLFISERHLPMEGTPNFRDLGGIINKDGKQIYWGQFFRSGSLESLTDNDLIYFKELGIKKVIDLRSHHEVEAAPDRLPDSTIHWQQVLIMNPSDMKSVMTEGVKLTPKMATQFLVESNKNFIINIKRFQPIIDALMGEEPFLFHCTAGKDRTGMSAALILMVLNVDRDIIMSDYLLSNTYTIPYYRANEKKMQMLAFEDDLVEELGGVKREYLQAAFNAIDSIYGSSEAMLEKEFGITPEIQKELVKKYTYVK